MDNLDFDAFIARYYYGASESRVCDIRRFLSHINNLLGGSPLEIKLLDKDFLCDVFYMQRLGAITRTHYQKIKEYLINLFDWCNISGSVPSQEEVIKSTQIYCYFKDLDSAMNFIDEVGNLLLSNYNKNKDLVIIKSIVILGWYGLSLKDIVQIKKRDVTKAINGGLVNVGGKQFLVDQKSIEVLMRLSSLEGYQSLPNGTYKYLQDFNDYLFRPTSMDCTGMRETYIAQSLQRFNNNVPRHLHQNIAFRNMHRNAMFVNIRKDDSGDSLIQKIMRHTNCSPKQSYSYRTQYLAWLELVENGVI